MKYKLSHNNYTLLKKVVQHVPVDDTKFDDEAKTIDTSRIRDILLAIDDAITYAGLTANQEECNEYGRHLYDLYDALYVQFNGKL